MATAKDNYSEDTVTYILLQNDLVEVTYPPIRKEWKATKVRIKRLTFLEQFTIID